MYNLIQLGWNEFFENQFKFYRDQNFIPARIAAENKERYTLFSEAGELQGEITGKLLYSAASPAELPKTGDWVCAVLFKEERKAIIHSVLERKTKISRNAADRKVEEQIIAANVDYSFIVQSLDDNFNIRRLERYVASSIESSVKPVIILNKADLNEDSNKLNDEVKKYFPSIKIILTNAINRTGIDEIKNIVNEGSTGVFIGSSGVGKSTIINSLLGKELLRINETSCAVNKGKHTTTKRELLVIPDGGIIIDTPGMREFQLWNVETGLNNIFDEIESLALTCKFSNCNHTNEKGCAVRGAIDKGIIDASRLKSYRKLQKELLYLKQKQDKNAFLKRKEEEKKFHKEIKNIYKRNNY